MHVEREYKNQKVGFLGLGNNVVRTKEQYTVGGKTHHGGPVSNHNTWIDPSAQGKGLSAKTIECIKARGSGEGTGRMVGVALVLLLVAPLVVFPLLGGFLRVLLR